MRTVAVWVSRLMSKDFTPVNVFQIESVYAILKEAMVCVLSEITGRSGNGEDNWLQHLLV